MIPGIRYRKYKWTLNSPRMQWVAEAEAVQTCAQLAIAVRKLDAVLQWDAVSKPRGGDNVPFSNAVIHAKRPAADGTGSEYLVENKITSFAEHAAAFAAMQQAPQQQLAALLLQQRIAMGHAFAIAQAQAQQAQQAQQAGISAPIPGRLGSLNQWGPQQAGGSASFAAAQWGAPRPFTLPGAPTYSFQQPGMLMPGSSTPQAAPAAANAAAAHPSAVAPAEEPGTKQEDTVMAEAPPVAPASVSGAPAMASVADAAPAVVGPSQPAPSPVGGVGVLMQVEPNAATAVAPPAAFMGMPGAAPMPAFGAISPEGFMVPFHMLPAQFAASMAAAPQQPAPSPAQEPQEEDTAALARKIVAQAIEKAVKEEEMAEAPAAMAAKMRNRQSSGAMGASGNLGDVAQGAVKTEGQGAASVPTGLPPKPPTPAPAVPLPGAPTWTHERDLPLWFIRTYEEKVSCHEDAVNPIVAS